jgi:ArsR family transcriptional regulator
VSVPLYQAEAEFFRMPAQPVRKRVLELLRDGPMPVRDLLAAIEVGPPGPSQQPAPLRRSGITSRREGSSVVHAIAGRDAADLMQAAHRIPTAMLTWHNELPTGLRETEVAAA